MPYVCRITSEQETIKIGGGMIRITLKRRNGRNYAVIDAPRGILIAREKDGGKSHEEMQDTTLIEGIELADEATKNID